MLMCLSSNDTVEEKIEVVILEWFFGDFNNFGIKLEADNERTFNLQRQLFRLYLLEFTNVIQQVGILFKIFNWKGFGSLCSTLL